jgi:hypothetical protein
MIEVRPDGTQTQCTQTQWAYRRCDGINGGTATCVIRGAHLLRTRPLADDNAHSGYVMHHSSRPPDVLHWIDFGRLRLGIDANGKWVVAAGSSNYVLSEDRDYYRLLSLLEHPYLEVVQTINAYRASGDVGIEFPFEAVIKAGLIGRMDYWADLALKWLPELSAERRRKLASALGGVVSSKWAKQGTRQRARRELERLLKDGE